jgi:hypothetical protein
LSQPCWVGTGVGALLRSAADPLPAELHRLHGVVTRQDGDAALSPGLAGGPQVLEGVDLLVAGTISRLCCTGLKLSIFRGQPGATGPEWYGWSESENQRLVACGV